MKNAIILTILLILVAISSVLAHSTFNVTKNTSTSSINLPSQCQDCTINISEGVTLTFSQNYYFQNTTFNGGTINLNGKTMTFWSDGTFNNTTVLVKSNANIVSSGVLNLTNTQFIFSDYSSGTFWNVVNMTSSSMSFVGDASMEATSTFNLKGGSFLSAGDGSTSSDASIKFNGGTLNLSEGAYVTMLGKNNYYYNWYNYNGVTSIKTTNNNLNCGTLGKNSCSAPVVYGPSTLTVVGVSSNATLPVKLSAFDAKLSGMNVVLSWTTDLEQKSSRFEIERSSDGINWTRIGTVKAQGNSTVKTNYTYNDVMKLESMLSYRLKIVDQDETFAYSPIKSVKSNVTGTEMKIFPNPATDYVVISNRTNTSNMNVQLINLNGQIVKQTNGNGSIQMSVTGVQPGNYAVKVIDAAGSSQTFKLMIK